jgi:integrase
VDAADDRAMRRAAPTVADLIERFMREEVRPTRKPRTSDLYDMYFRVHVLPALGFRRAREITLADIAKLHRKIGAKTPVTANRVVALMSAVFSWAARLGEVPEDLNPVRGITRYREQGRERFLSSDEIVRLGEVLREAETVGLPWTIDETRATVKHVPRKNRMTKVSPFATAAIRLLLLTGCRPREVLNLRWEEFDRERGMLFCRTAKPAVSP